MPKDRWDIHHYYSDDRGEPGKMLELTWEAYENGGCPSL